MPSRVVIVTDQDVWVRSLDSTLAPHGYDVRVVAPDPRELEQLPSLHPRLLIVQNGEGDLAATQACADLRARGLIEPTVPVILIVPGPCTRETRLAALRAGAWECYGFPPDPEMLLLKLDLYTRSRAPDPLSDMDPDPGAPLS